METSVAAGGEGYIVTGANAATDPLISAGMGAAAPVNGNKVCAALSQAGIVC